MPCIVTEHYAKALGTTVPDLALSPDQKTTIFQKKDFSMLTDEVMTHLKTVEASRQEVILCGIEAHVCILQTCLQLIKEGYNVRLVCDATSSQRYVVVYL